MNKNPVMLDKSAYLSEALDLMKKKEVDAVLVIDAEKLSGIVTYRDIMKKIGSRRSSRETPSTMHLSGFMTPHLDKNPLKTVIVEDEMDKVIELMLKNDVSHIPVLNKSGKIAGILSKNDVIKLCINIRAQAYELMIKNPITVSRTDSIDEARRILLDKKITSLPVTEGDKLIGLINVHNIACGLAAFKEVAPPKTLDKRIKFLLVSDLMEREPPSATPSTKASSIAKLMINSPSRSIPIVDENDKLLGIISRTDMIKLFYEKVQ